MFFLNYSLAISRPPQNDVESFVHVPWPFDAFLIGASSVAVLILRIVAPNVLLLIE